MFPFQKHILIITLIIQFWISGLFVLSVIWTQKDDLQNLTLYTFIAYAIASFIAGILSDIYGRKPIFLFSTIILTCSAFLLLVQPFYGYIMANLAIGPLNNLTFVFINQVHPERCQKYTIFVLIGWACSEISLGLFFLLCKPEYFSYILLTVTIIFMALSMLYVKQTQQFQRNKQKLQRIQQLNNIQRINLSSNSSSSDQTLNKIKIFLTQKIIPSTIKPLIGGSILMFTMQMFYYRTQFTLDRFGISLQINTIVVGCTQVFANVLFTKILQSTKRRLALRYLIGGLMVLLLFLVISNQIWVQTVVEGFMRLVDTAIMIVLGVYIPQLFPSHQKGRGTNFIMSFGVIGSALNGKLFSHLPFWSLELFLLSAICMTLLLRQTLILPVNNENSVKSIQKQSLQDKLIKPNEVQEQKQSENLQS